MSVPTTSKRKDSSKGCDNDPRALNRQLMQDKPLTDDGGKSRPRPDCRKSTIMTGIA